MLPRTGSWRRSHHRRLVRIDRRIVDHILVEQRLRGLVAVGVEDIVRCLGGDLRPHDVVDELMSLGDVLGVSGDRHLIEPHLGALLRDDVGDVDALVGLGGAVARLEEVAREADGKADVAVGQRVDELRRMELADRGPDAEHELLGLGDVVGRGGIGVEAEIVQGGRDDVGRRIQEIDAAIGELGDVLRLEDDVPAVDHIEAERFLDLLGVVADTGGAPHVVDRIFVAGIELGHALGDLTSHMLARLGSFDLSSFW